LEKEKELLLPADTDQRDLVPFSRHPFKIESDSTAVEFAAQSTVQQCNPLHNKSVALAPQKCLTCFWCNCEKGYIYPLLRQLALDVSRGGASPQKIGETRAKINCFSISPRITCSKNHSPV